MKFRFLAALLVVVWLMHMAAWAGLENDTIKEPNTSEHKAGSKFKRNYMLPSTPEFDRTDRDELDDYRKKEYTPYAQLMVFAPVKIGEVLLNPGYYLVKLKLIGFPNTPKPSPLAPTLPDEPKNKGVLIIKREGEVEVAVPIAGTTKLDKKVKKGPFSKLLLNSPDVLNQQVLSLEYCMAYTCYQSVPLRPGLIQ